MKSIITDKWNFIYFWVWLNEWNARRIAVPPIYTSYNQWFFILLSSRPAASLRYQWFFILLSSRPAASLRYQWFFILLSSRPAASLRYKTTSWYLYSMVAHDSKRVVALNQYLALQVICLDRPRSWSLIFLKARFVLMHSPHARIAWWATMSVIKCSKISVLQIRLYII